MPATPPGERVFELTLMTCSNRVAQGVVCDLHVRVAQSQPATSRLPLAKQIRLDLARTASWVKHSCGNTERPIRNSTADCECPLMHKGSTYMQGTSMRGSESVCMADVIVKLNLAPGVCHRAAAEPERISAARSPIRAHAVATSCVVMFAHEPAFGDAAAGPSCRTLRDGST